MFFRSISARPNTLAWSVAFCFFSTIRALALDPSKSITQYAHTMWTQMGSVPRSVVTAMEQTDDGYLWLGTEDAGLVRFDGARFTQSVSTLLSNTPIYSLKHSKNGGLWIGTKAGLAILKGGVLTMYAKGDRLGTGSVLAIHEDPDGVVWVGTYGYQVGGISRIEQGHIQTFGSLEGLATSGIHDIYRDRSGRLWICGEWGLSLWDGKPVLVVPRDKSGETWSIAEGLDGALWLATDVDVRSRLQHKITVHSPLAGTQDVQPRRVLVDRTGGVWVATRGQGLFHFGAGRWSRMTHADGLSSDKIWALLEDREGNVWAGTASGLDRFREYAVTSISTGEGLQGEAVSSLVVDQKGELCAGTQTIGVHCLPGGKTYRLPIRNTSILSLYAPRGNFIVATDHGIVTTGGGGVSILNSKLKAVYSIAEDRNHSLWLGDTRRGLFQLTPEGRLIEAPDHRFEGKGVLFLLADHAGRLWITDYQGGVTLYQDGSFRSFALAPEPRANFVPSLFEDHAGAIWAATEGGLSLYRDGSFATLTTQNGLPCNSIHEILEDDLQFLWLTTSCGLVRAKLEDLKHAAQNSSGLVHCDLFGLSDGFRATVLHATKPRVAKTPDGKLWFASEEGISFIDPRNIPRNTVAPPVHIEQIGVDGKVVDAKNAAKLPPTVTRLEFDYTALSFADPERVLFRYQLEGFDSTWIEAGTRRQAFYTNLRPGGYRFHVIACNNHGVWNEQGDAFAFEVESAFLQTRLFGWICAAAGMVFLRAVYYLKWHHTPGILLQRWFRAYPTGFPGLGLVLLRFAVGLDLLTHVMVFSPFTISPGSIGPQIARFLEGCGGLLLIAGLATPIVSGLLTWVVLVEMLQRAANDAAYASLGGAWEYGILYLVVLGSLTLLGPGAYSLDARLFGRRRVTVMSA